MTISRSNIVKAAAAAAVAFAALGTASVAQARDNINWSVGINAAPGVVIGASNGYYAPPVYVQPQTYYPQNVYPSSYYVQPAPIYVAPPVYYRPAPVYYGPSFYYRDGHRHHRGHRR